MIVVVFSPEISPSTDAMAAALPSYVILLFGVVPRGGPSVGAAGAGVTGEVPGAGGVPRRRLSRVGGARQVGGSLRSLLAQPLGFRHRTVANCRNFDLESPYQLPTGQEV